MAAWTTNRSRLIRDLEPGSDLLGEVDLIVDDHGRWDAAVRDQDRLAVRHPA